MTPHSPDFRSVIDHTFLKTEKENVSLQDQERLVRKLVEEALEERAFGVCIQPRWVKMARSLAGTRPLPIVTVIGFPVAETDTTATATIDEMNRAREDGADEFDMVVQVEELKKRHLARFEEHIYNIAQAAKNNVLKIIFENAYLTDEEKALAYGIAKEALEASWHDSKLSPQEAVRFFKTSTGFAKSAPGVPIGATLGDVRLMAQIAGKDIGIKPAGGVNSYAEALSYWKAAGAPLNASGLVDPYRFRIGSSNLLHQLNDLKE